MNKRRSGNSRKRNRVLTTVLLAFAGLLLLCVSVYVYLADAYTVIGSDTPRRLSSLCRCDVRELDLAAESLADLDGIERCSRLESLSLSGSSIDDLSAVKELDSLRSLDMTGCKMPLESFTELADALPDCDILWDVPMNGQIIRSDAESITLTGAGDGDYELLRCFKKLRSVELSDCDITPRLLELREAMPACAFHWTVSLCGEDVECGAAELDLNGKPVDEQELIAAVRRLPAMEHIELCDSGLSNEQMEGLIAEFPKIKFVWRIYVGAWDIRTDVTNFSCGHLKPVSTIASKRIIHNDEAQQFKYCTDLVALDLGHQKISDFSFLESLTKLRSLIIVDNPVSDISPIGKLVNLEYMELFSNEISDITPLANLKKLREVNLCDNSIRDASPLYELEKLEKVWIAENAMWPAQQSKLLKEVPEGCKVCFELDIHKHPCSKGWRPIDYRLWGFRYEHPLNEGMTERQINNSYNNRTSADIDPDA